jgi:hypothetical protein
VFETRQRQESFLQETAKPVPVGPIQPPNQRVSRNISVGVKHPAREAVRPNPSSADVKNERIDTCFYYLFLSLQRDECPLTHQIFPARCVEQDTLS